MSSTNRAGVGRDEEAAPSDSSKPSRAMGTAPRRHLDPDGASDIAFEPFPPTVPRRHADPNGASDFADEPNPKTNPTDNAEKDPDDWVTGGEAMTGAQASYLKTLSEQAGEGVEGYEEGLTKADASKRIDALRVATGKA